MKNFFKWCEDKRYNLEELLKFNETPPEEKTKDEGSTKRAGLRPHAYPPIYSRGQYPKSYMRPTAADAAVYQDQE